MPNIFVSNPLKLSDSALECDYVRADLELLGLRHAGPTYEARIFINNPDADTETKPITGEGYAGCFYVFGHGGCFGDTGHCHVPVRRPGDPRKPHPLTPLSKTITITKALRAHVKPEEPFRVTIVAEPRTLRPPEDGDAYLTEFESDYDSVLKFDELRVVIYDA